MEELQNNGFFIIKNLIPIDSIAWHLNDIKDKISQSSLELGVSTANYLNCTGRWGDSSQITSNISQSLHNVIKDSLEKLLDCRILQKKSNVICKNADLIDAVPFHQDISYSYDNPYHFSVWLALNNVDKTSGALQIIKNSHIKKIKSAVDFWSPYFVDQYSSTLSHQKILTLPVSAGDAIVFDSRLWHGSGKNLDAKDRFAYVTRWVIKDKKFPDIPTPKPLIFGMFNCGLLTEYILKKSLLYISQGHDIGDKNKEELIKIWLSYLKNTPDFPKINVAQATKDLSQLLILHRASILHNAGDISGKVYKNVWFSLLSILNTKVQVVKLKL